MTPGHPADLVLTTDQNWAARSHRELYDAVHQNNDPGKSGEIGWHWEQFGTGLTESARIIGKELTETEHGWTGASADAARAAIRLLVQWIRQTAHDATELGAKVQEESLIVAAARAAMPEPVEFDWNAATGTLSGPGIASFAASAADVQAANDKARAAHEQAVAVMTEMERQSRAVDQTTPHFTAPFNPTTGQTEQIKVATPAAGGAETLRTAVAAESVIPESGESPQARPQEPVQERESAEQALTASTSVASGQMGPVYSAPSEQASHPNQHHSGPGGTIAAAAAAAATGAGMGMYGRRGGGRPSDEPGIQATPTGPGDLDELAIPQGADPTIGAAPRSGGEQQPPKTAMPPQPGAVPSGFGPSGGKPSRGLAAGAGGSHGFAGTGGMPGMSKGKPQDSEVKPGRGLSVGATDFTDEPDVIPKTPGVAGTSTPAGTAPMGAVPPMGGVPRSPGEEDMERKTAYVQSEDIFEVPGDDLPPSVIGGRKTRKGGNPS